LTFCLVKLYILGHFCTYWLVCLYRPIAFGIGYGKGHKHVRSITFPIKIRSRTSETNQNSDAHLSLVTVRSNVALRVTYIGTIIGPTWTTLNMRVQCAVQCVHE